MRLAVIGDVHANHPALNAALEVVGQRGCDQIIFSGDLLTYGPEPNRCLNEILGLKKNYGVSICVGNHDQVYIDLIEHGKSPYMEKLPEWIKESFDWTFSVLDRSLWSELEFKQHIVSNKTYFSHANPYGPNCWSYINTFAEHSDAIERIEALDCKLAFFGHTHRKKIFARDNSGACGFSDDRYLDCNELASAIVNVGSIGQPRGDMGCYVFIVEHENCTPTNVEMVNLVYDINQHLSKLNALPITAGAKQKMASYFTGS